MPLITVALLGAPSRVQFLGDLLYTDHDKAEWDFIGSSVRGVQVHSEGVKYDVNFLLPAIGEYRAAVKRSHVLVGCFVATEMDQFYSLQTALKELEPISIPVIVAALNAECASFEMLHEVYSAV